MNIRLATARVVIVGPILDSAGAAKTDEVVASILASKNGSDPAALNASATLTHKAAGYYRLALTTSDTDTLGCLEMILSSTTNTMPVKQLNVMSAAAWDALHAASGGVIPADLIQYAGSTAPLLFDGRIDAHIGALADGAITSAKFTVGSITGPASGILEQLRQVWRRFYAKATATAEELVTYADDGTTALTTQAIADDGTTQTQGPAT